jgi:hypothetical protein
MQGLRLSRAQLAVALQQVLQWVNASGLPRGAEQVFYSRLRSNCRRWQVGGAG